MNIENLVYDVKDYSDYKDNYSHFGNIFLEKMKNRDVLSFRTKLYFCNIFQYQKIDDGRELSDMIIYGFPIGAFNSFFETNNEAVVSLNFEVLFDIFDDKLKSWKGEEKLYFYKNLFPFQEYPEIKDKYYPLIEKHIID